MRKQIFNFIGAMLLYLILGFGMWAVGHVTPIGDLLVGQWQKEMRFNWGSE